MTGQPKAPWTVGQLRAALDGVPDEARVRVFYVEDTEADTVGEQVVVKASLENQIWYPDGQGYEPARTPADTWFTVETEFPADDYHRGPR